MDSEDNVEESVFLFGSDYDKTTLKQSGNSHACQVIFVFELLKFFYELHGTCSWNLVRMFDLMRCHSGLNKDDVGFKIRSLAQIKEKPCQHCTDLLVSQAFMKLGIFVLLLSQSYMILRLLGHSSRWPWTQKACPIYN